MDNPDRIEIARLDAELTKARDEIEQLRAGAFAMLAAIAFVNDECSADDLRTAVAEYLKESDSALELWLDAHHADCARRNAKESARGR